MTGEEISPTFMFSTKYFKEGPKSLIENDVDQVEGFTNNPSLLLLTSSE